MGAAVAPLPSPRSDLERILALLPPDHRRVLQLRFHEGCTIKDTARAMHVSVANAKALQYQAVLCAAAQMGKNLLGSGCQASPLGQSACDQGVDGVPARPLPLSPQAASPSSPAPAT